MTESSRMSSRFVRKDSPYKSELERLDTLVVCTKEIRGWIARDKAGKITGLGDLGMIYTQCERCPSPRRPLVESQDLFTHTYTASDTL